MTQQIRICEGTGCISSKSKDVEKTFRGLNSDADVEISGCHGFCSQGPLVVIDDILYTHVNERDVKYIAKGHDSEDPGARVESLYYQNPRTKERIKNYRNIPFYNSQTRIMLENCGRINPEKIDDYIELGGYEGLKKSLTMDPDDIIQEIIDSGLRGRGGAGFPTGMKWRFTRQAQGDQKYVIINADEGDPGAFMDRSILEADPHSVIEGAIIGAYAIGATKGYIYVRAEYPLAVKRFRLAIQQAKERGFLGNNILSSGFSFDLIIYEGAGAFVCGEETALIASIEGGRGNPVPKPPFPANKGLWDQPTNINNVKTWAAASWIMKNGKDKFRTIGTEKSPGTAIFSLTGKINNSGLIEVPMGTTLREIIYNIGGGIQDGGNLKAVQTGGPSGGCIPAEYIDTPVDYDSLSKLGSIMGSGGMVVIDNTTCIVDFAKYFLNFTQDESCGKCTPCREGTLRALEMLERITEGNGSREDLIELQELSEVIKTTSLCGLGQTAPNPVLSTIRYFEKEYLEHIEEQKCRAGVCVGLFAFEIDHEECNNCSRCQRGCSFDAIKGNRDEGFVIKTDVCEGCRLCFETCPQNAIKVIHP